MRVHAANLLSNFQRQHANENLQSFIHQYTKMHQQATGLRPENDYDLSRKVEFMKRIRTHRLRTRSSKATVSRTILDIPYKHVSPEHLS